MPSGAPWNAGVVPRQRGAGGPPPVTAAASAMVKRSQTFSPSAATAGGRGDYVCRLNRSDSDSAMSLNKRRLAFQKSMLERRSLRVPPSKMSLAALSPPPPAEGAKPKQDSSKSGKKKKRGSSSQQQSPSLQTDLDLELDLAAQQTKLQVLQEEIDRLKEIKSRLEEAKEKGVRELPAWLQEHDRFHSLLSRLQSEAQEAQTAEERRVERMLRKTSRDIYRLRKTRTASRGQLDVQAFKEKMAFFTTLRNEVPVPMDEEEEEEEEGEKGSSTLKAKKEEEEEEDGGARVTVTHLSSGGDLVRKVVASGGGGGGGLGASSTETVDTITGEEEEGEKGEKGKGEKEEKRFSYEVDPDIGVIV